MHVKGWATLEWDFWKRWMAIQRNQVEYIYSWIQNPLGFVKQIFLFVHISFLCNFSNYVVVVLLID